MAKRKRLSPAISTLPDHAPAAKTFTRFPAADRDEPPARPPIAQVAGDAASSAALAELADELRDARETGRMVLNLPLDAVDENHLVRDRMLADEEELAVLVDSIRDQGQRTPIEVVELGPGRYGLISGWRRLTALKRLAGDGDGTVLALLRQPDTASEAYRAMVEENELRVGLSYYERARIVAKAADQGVFHNDATALKGLFGSTTRSRRSKIGAFLRLYRALDQRLKYPGSINERLGLALVRAIDADDGFGTRLADRLRKADAQDATQELSVLEQSLGRSPKKQSLTHALDIDSGSKPAPKQAPGKVAFGSVTLEAPGNGKRLVLSGAGVTPEFRARLEAWLAGQGG